MTTSSQTLSRTLPGLATRASGLTASGVRARFDALRTALSCLLNGHTTTLGLAERRLFLSCPACRTESPGWRLDLAAPRIRFDGATDRFDRYAWIMGRRPS